MTLVTMEVGSIQQRATGSTNNLLSLERMPLDHICWNGFLVRDKDRVFFKAMVA